MSLPASRVVLRRSTFAVRRAGTRNASSTSEATGAAKEKAAQAQSKASEGLTKVQSSAGNAMERVGSMATGTMNSLANAGGRTGRLVGRIQSLIPPTIHYSRVALELGKFVARERKMSPPDVATFQSYFQNLFGRLRSGNIMAQAEKNTPQPANALNQVRNLSHGDWLTAGVVIAEAIGFFSVGEMIGRWKIVGYRSSAPAEH